MTNRDLICQPVLSPAEAGFDFKCPHPPQARAWGYLLLPASRAFNAARSNIVLRAALSGHPLAAQPKDLR
jgi:hypothetical protein